MHFFAPYDYGRVPPTGANPASFGVHLMSDLIEETFSVLHELREEADCEENARAVEKIDVVIDNLEKIRDQNHSEEQIKQLCLQAIGAAIKCLPTIARFIELIQK